MLSKIKQKFSRNNQNLFLKVVIIPLMKMIWILKNTNKTQISLNFNNKLMILNKKIMTKNYKEVTNNFILIKKALI